MLKVLKLSLLLLLSAALLGCTVSTDGWISGSISYHDPGPGSGYGGPPTGLPLGSLGCRITYPPNNASADWYQTVWIYGVIWREGMNVDAYPWGGIEWEVDNWGISRSYYSYDQLIPEIWVRFPFRGKEIGPGIHTITLSVWDHRYGGSRLIYDTITLYVN